VKRQRTKHPAPVLFGERMKLAADFGHTVIWCRVYGDVTAFIRYRPSSTVFLYSYSFGSRDGRADTAKAAIRLLESLIRRTGRALPWAATVSRAFARSHGR
jgi:hypothetical protein